MAKAEINAEIMEDGVIKFTTDKIPDEHHADAEKFIEEVKELMGGPVVVIHKRAGHVHTNEKGEQIHHHH